MSLPLLDSDPQYQDMFEPGNYRRRKRMRRHAYKASGLAGFKSWPISDHATTAAAAAAAAASQFIYGHRHPAYFHTYPHISHPPPPPPPPPTQPPPAPW